MIALSKLLIGAGALGAAGLSAWGIYYASTPKNIQDKLSREGLKILNLDKNSNADEADWKQKITGYRPITGTDSEQAKLKISGLDLLSEADQDAENIKKFKDKCSDLLVTFLGIENSDLKEQQARKWCVK